MRRDGFQYMDLDDFEELLADKPDDEKWELIGGRVVRLMVGARWEHNIIIGNLATAFRQQLRARSAPCQVFSETFWLKERFLDLAAFPDIMVRCGAKLEKNATSANDPIILVEVAAPGSEARDRVEKDRLYRRLSSLQHYVIVERDRCQIDVIDRIDGEWRGRRVEGLGGMLELPAISVSVPMHEIYRDVIDSET